MNLKQSLHRKPLHIQVAEVLRKHVIPRFKPGERIGAESKLAEQLGISVVTLRQSLSVLEHEGIIERRHGSGTFVTDHVRKRFVALVTYLCNSVRDSDFQARVFRLVDTVLRERGLHTRFFVQSYGADDPEIWADFRRDVSNGSMSGAIFMAMMASDLATSLKQRGIPFVVTSDEFSHSVQVDYDAMLRDGTRYLLEHGCRKIALMRWSDSTAEESRARSIKQFKAMMDEYGATIHEKWQRLSVPPNAPGSGWEQFRDIWAAEAEKPDGLLVLDDVLFRDVALGILETGVKVPDQLQIVAHANKGSGFAYPFPVTTMEIDPQEFANAIVDLLMDSMKNKKVHTPARSIRAQLIPAATQKATAFKV